MKESKADNPAGERISIKEFARRLGVTDTAVKKAYKAGKIVNGIVYPPEGGNPYVLPDVASREWAQHYDETYERRSPTLASKLAAAAQQPTPGQAQAQVQPADAGDATVVGNSSLANAKRLQALLTVKRMELELRRQQGELVELRKVNDELFVAGKEIRDGVLGVVDRVIDDVMSCTTRGQAFLVLHNALSQELERISNLPKRINNG